jgi:hypothetical protein
MTTYTKLDEGNYQIIETVEETKTVNLAFLEADILHKDKLIAELEEGIVKLQKEKADLIALKNNLLKAK